MLRCLILRRGTSEETFQTLDLAALAKETEGYTPQDLAVLLERAVHASVAQRGDSDGNAAACFFFKIHLFRLEHKPPMLMVIALPACALRLVSDGKGLHAGP